MPCYNVDVTLEYAIKAIIDSPMCDELILCEGGWNPTKEIRSTDKTIEIIEKFSSNPKVKSLTWWPQSPNDYEWKCEAHKNRLFAHNKVNGHPFYDGPSLTQQMLCRDTMLDMATGDWIFLVDADEIHAPESLMRLRKLINSGITYDLLTLKARVFYFDFWNYADERFRRIFRKKEGCYFSDDNSIDVNGESYDNNKFDVPEEFDYYFHYAYIGKERVNKKLDMWNAEDAERWKKIVWEEKSMGKIMMNNYGGVHLFAHKNMGYAGYKLKKFSGLHPEIIRNHPDYFEKRFK
mgnify:FL=1